MNIELERKLNRISTAAVIPISKIVLDSSMFLFGYDLIPEGLENIPEGPCMFVPKHQYMADIPLLGNAVYERKIRPIYFMRPMGIATPLLWLYGGRTIYRAKDVRRISNRKKREKAIIKMERSREILENEFNHNGAAVVFAEGTRTLGNVREFTPTFFEHCFEYEKNTGRKVKISPVGFEYNLERKIKKIHIRFGEPIGFNGRDLKEIINETKEAVKKLSNL